jgi:hypothetical protein
MRSSLSLFCVLKIHCSSTDDMGAKSKITTWPHRTLNPQMASPRFPFSHIPSELPFFPVVRKEGSPTYGGDYRRPTTPKGRATWTWRIPKWLSCIGFDHRQAIHLLQHRSSMSHKDSSRLQRQKSSPRASPLRVGFPHGRTHQLDGRRPSRPSKRPTREASEPGSLKAPFQPPTQKQTPLFHISSPPLLSVGASHNVSLGC